MSYIFRQIEGGLGQDEGDRILEAVREIEVEGEATDYIGVRFRPSSNGVSPRDLDRVDNWRDLPTKERTALYWREGKQVRHEYHHVKEVSKASTQFFFFSGP